MATSNNLSAMAYAARAVIAAPARVSIVGDSLNPRFQLFYSTVSICSQKTRAVFHEKKLPYRSNDMIIQCS